MIRIYCDGCDNRIEEIQTFDWIKVEVISGVLRGIFNTDQDAVGFWCTLCKEKKDRVFLITKANKVFAMKRIDIDGKKLFKSEMEK